MTQKNVADISIIIVTFNRPRLLINTIDNILLQSTLPKEVIIVDNNSTDDIAKLVKDRFNQSWITCHKIHNNQTCSNARNFGIEHSSGRFILFLDDDDLLGAKFIEKQYDMITSQNLDVVFSNFVTFFSNSSDLNINTLDSQFTFHRKMIEWVAKLVYKVPALQISKNPFAFICLTSPVIHSGLIRREKIGKTRFREDLIYCEDLYFWTKLGHKKLKFGFQNEVLVYYRKHGLNLTNTYLKKHSLNFYELVRKKNLVTSELEKYLLNSKLLKYNMQIPEKRKNVWNLLKTHMKYYKYFYLTPFAVLAILLMKVNDYIVYIKRKKYT